MDAKSLISYELPALSIDDSGDKALSLMNEFRVYHLPLIQRDNYLALISEDDLLDWDTPEQPLSLAEFVNFRPAIFENVHPFEAIKLAREFNLSVVPVVDINNHYLGVITEEGLFSYLTDNNAIKVDGAILVLQLEPRNYSLSEIARLCESNDISILSVFLKTIPESGMILVTLKVNRMDIKALIATFERYSYHVVEFYSNDNQKEDLQQNYDILMHYINL